MTKSLGFPAFQIKQWKPGGHLMGANICKHGKRNPMAITFL